MNIIRYIKSYQDQPTEYTEIESGDLLRPYVAYLEDEDRIDWDGYVEPPHDYDKDPLTFIFNQPATIELIKNGSPNSVSLKYSLDEGTTWNTFPSTLKVNISGDGEHRVMFKGTNPSGFALSESDYHRFSVHDIVSTDTKVPFNLEGNIMSLIDETNYPTLDSTWGQQGTRNFYAIFVLSSVVDASNLSLPATKLRQSDYQGLFSNCKSLITAPKILPAVTGNQSLTLTYYRMFENCTSLINPPESIQIGQIDYVQRAFEGMFYGCTALKRTPILNIDFSKGSNNTQTDELKWMFRGCTALETVICLSPVPISADNLITSGWLMNAPATGTFYYKPSVDWSAAPRNANGVPTGWDLVPYEEE